MRGRSSGEDSLAVSEGGGILKIGDAQERALRLLQEGRYADLEVGEVEEA